MISVIFEIISLSLVIIIYFDSQGIISFTKKNSGLFEIKPIRVYHNCTAENFSLYAIKKLKNDIEKEKTKGFFMINTISPLNYYNDFKNVISVHSTIDTKLKCQQYLVEFNSIYNSPNKNDRYSYEDISKEINGIINEYSGLPTSKEHPSMCSHFPLFNRQNQSRNSCIRIHIVDQKFIDFYKKNELKSLYFFKYILNYHVRLFFIEKTDIMTKLGHLEKFSNDYVTIFYTDPSKESDNFRLKKPFKAYDYFKDNEVLHFITCHKGFRNFSKKKKESTIRNNYALYDQFYEKYDWKNGIIKDQSVFFTFETLISVKLNNNKLNG